VTRVSTATRNTAHHAVSTGTLQRPLIGLLVAVALALGGCSASGTIASPQPTSTAYQPTSPAPEISVIQASALYEQGAFVLDVREPSEWASGHIRGATLIPLGELAGRMAEVPHDQAVVIVCHSGNRSAQARDLLRQAGFDNVTSMAGGMTAWLAAGLPVTTGS
jgi:rhodanese-related sulfurtransferase